MECKDYNDDINGALDRMRRLSSFQLLHNELNKDFGELYRITSTTILKGNKCPELIRSCVRELFSLIEADIYYLNFIEPYKDYKDRSGVIEKFKKTYKYHCENFNRLKLYDDFLQNHWEEFNKLKIIRDKITHPKSQEDLIVTNETFESTHKLFTAYSNFITNIMTNTGVKFNANKLADFFKSMG